MDCFAPLAMAAESVRFLSAHISVGVSLGHRQGIIPAMVEVCRNGPPYHAPYGTTSTSGGELSGIPAHGEYHSRSEKKARSLESWRRATRRGRSRLKGARDFWLSCGHHLLDRDAHGGLLVTDDFLKAYLARPEIAPPPEACSAERELHGALLLDPRRPVAPSRIAAIVDADARENWIQMIAWRDHLAKHATLEASYVDLVRRSLKFPHVFIDQLAHVISRNMLEGCDDAFVLRAAELFFRPQKLALRGEALIAADEEAASKFEVGILFAAGISAGMAHGGRDRCPRRRQRRSLLGAQR